LASEDGATRLKAETHEIVSKVIELNKIAQLKGPIREHQMAPFTERYGFQKFLVPSPLEIFF
jgi:hypothetical protein